MNIPEKGLAGVELPKETAQVNELLEAMSPTMREQMLLLFINRLFVDPERGAAQPKQ